MSGSSNQAEVDRLLALAQSRGLDADVKPVEELAIDMTPEEIRASTMKLVRHLEDPEGVPVHHTSIEAEGRNEIAVSCSGLDPDRQWFALGLMYTLIQGIDRSVFEVFRSAGAPRGFNVLTHQADKAVLEVEGADFSRNPWSGVLQGIPRDCADKFSAFLASYRFKSGSPDILGATDQVWRVDWADVRMADPFRDQLVGTYVRVALPVNLRTGRGVRLVRGAGLGLAPPGFAVVDLQNDEEVKSYAE